MTDEINSKSHTPSCVTLFQEKNKEVAHGFPWLRHQGEQAKGGEGRIRSIVLYVSSSR